MDVQRLSTTPLAPDGAKNKSRSSNNRPEGSFKQGPGSRQVPSLHRSVKRKPLGPEMSRVWRHHWPALNVTLHQEVSSFNIQHCQTWLCPHTDWSRVWFGTKWECNAQGWIKTEERNKQKTSLVYQVKKHKKWLRIHCEKHFTQWLRVSNFLTISPCSPRLACCQPWHVRVREGTNTWAAMIGADLRGLLCKGMTVMPWL